MASLNAAIVLAVNIPPHVPGPAPRQRRTRRGARVSGHRNGIHVHGNHGGSNTAPGPRALPRRGGCLALRRLHGVACFSMSCSSSMSITPPEYAPTASNADCCVRYSSFPGRLPGRIVPPYSVMPVMKRRPGARSRDTTAQHQHDCQPPPFVASPRASWRQRAHTKAQNTTAAGGHTGSPSAGQVAVGGPPAGRWRLVARRLAGGGW